MFHERKLRKLLGRLKEADWGATRWKTQVAAIYTNQLTRATYLGGPLQRRSGAHGPVQTGAEGCRTWHASSGQPLNACTQWKRIGHVDTMQFTFGVSFLGSFAFTFAS